MSYLKPFEFSHSCARQMELTKRVDVENDIEIEFAHKKKNCKVYVLKKKFNYVNVVKKKTIEYKW